MQGVVQHFKQANAVTGRAPIVVTAKFAVGVPRSTHFVTHEGNDMSEATFTFQVD